MTTKTEAAAQTKLHTTFTQIGRNKRRWYVVQTPAGKIVWQGTANSSADARAKVQS